MNPKTERECHCRVTCPMPDGDAYEGDHAITFCAYHKRQGQKLYAPIILTELGWRQTDFWKQERAREAQDASERR